MNFDLNLLTCIVILLELLGGSLLTVNIRKGDIIRMMVHFNKNLPIVFLYVTPSACASIRAEVGMERRFGLWIDVSESGKREAEILRTSSKECQAEELNFGHVELLKQHTMLLDETMRRVTILPERLEDDHKVILKKIYSHDLEELNSKRANEMLVHSSPKEGLNARAIQLMKQEAPSNKSKVCSSS